jgi:hypothetical protein
VIDVTGGADNQGMRNHGFTRISDGLFR